MNPLTWCENVYMEWIGTRRCLATNGHRELTEIWNTNQNAIGQFMLETLHKILPISTIKKEYHIHKIMCSSPYWPPTGNTDFRQVKFILIQYIYMILACILYYGARQIGNPVLSSDLWLVQNTSPIRLLLFWGKIYVSL